MALNPTNLLKVLLPKKAMAKAVALTATFNPSSKDQVLTLPRYRDHLTDIFTTRSTADSRELMKNLFVHDPDVSATVAAFLTLSNTEPRFVCYDEQDNIDRAAQQTLNLILQALTTRFDYSKGFEIKNSLNAYSEAFRYIALLRGTIAAELILNEQKLPVGIRVVDPASLEWFEKEPGNFKPQQSANNTIVNLDIPTFFTAFYRRDPTAIYTQSAFVSTINTVSARQQVVNDLYRIMRFTGYPRIEVTVMEDVLRKSAPTNLKDDPAGLSAWVNGQIQSISQTISDLRPEQAFVHTDAVEASVLNEKMPGLSINIDSIIQTLNAQNQAALRTMSTIIGRGTSGVNTASVEARVFSMNAQELNQPVADLWSQMLTMAIRILGHEASHVWCEFAPVEMRSETELAPMKSIYNATMREELSLGLITDDEYHIAIHGRIRPDTVPELSGTNFAKGTAPAGRSDEVSPNDDPLGRAVTPSGREAEGG